MKTTQQQFIEMEARALRAEKELSEVCELSLKATNALGYLDGMPERGSGKRFDDCIDGGDIVENVKGYIIHLENKLGITAR